MMTLLGGVTPVKPLVGTGLAEGRMKDLSAKTYDINPRNQALHTRSTGCMKKTYLEGFRPEPLPST